MQLANTLGLNGDYPATWEGFIGQTAAKRQLLIAARSAKMRGVPMDHVLIASGESGVGKTTLGLLIAQELETNVKIVSNKIGLGQVRILLSDMSDNDVLIIDEIHTLVAGGKSQAEQWILHFMENGTIIGPLGPEECPKVTLVGATTDPGRLPETVLSRFPIKPVIVSYTEEEAAHIAIGMASRTMPKELNFPNEENFKAIARAANHNPRIMRSIVSNLRDIAICSESSNWVDDETGYELEEALGFLGLSSDGLDLTARRYLHALRHDFPNGAGKTAIRDRLGEPGGLGYTEKVLTGKGLIALTQRGRVLTTEGIKRAKILTQADVS